MIIERDVNPDISRFLDFLHCEKGFSHNTTKAYRNDLFQFWDFLQEHENGATDGERFWDLVNPDVLNQYIKDLRDKKGYRDTTIARKVASLKSFFGFLNNDDAVSIDPAKSLEFPRISRLSLQCLTGDQVATLLGLASRSRTVEGKRNTVILELLYTTGLKIGEVVFLNTEDIDFTANCIYCYGAGKRERIVSLLPKMVTRLRQYIATTRENLLSGKQDELALFVNHRGERLTRQWMWFILKRYGEKAGIDQRITPSILRHSFANHLLQDGFSLRYVQELLGNSSIFITRKMYLTSLSRSKVQIKPLQV